MIETPSFSTSRLVFRSPEPADFEQPNGFLWNLYNDESVQHGLTANSVRPQTKEQVEKWFKQLSETAALDCIFCVKDGGDGEKKATQDLEPAGWLTIDKINNLHRKATFGLAISPKHQGKGYAKEAMEWMLERAFNGYGLNKVEGEVFAWNEAALKCYKSVGFVEEGRRRQTVWQNGAFRDDYFMGILASEWRERRSKEKASESK